MAREYFEVENFQPDSCEYDVHIAMNSRTGQVPERHTWSELRRGMSCMGQGAKRSPTRQRTSRGLSHMSYDNFTARRCRETMRITSLTHGKTWEAHEEEDHLVWGNNKTVWRQMSGKKNRHSAQSRETAHQGIVHRYTGGTGHCTRVTAPWGSSCLPPYHVCLLMKPSLLLFPDASRVPK